MRPFAPLPIRSVFVSVLLLGLAACSVRKMALKSIGGALSNAATEYARDEDPELVKGALPFSLKVMETILREDPKDAAMLLNLTKGFTQYSFGFVIADAEEMDDKDKVAAKALRERAVRLLMRARAYGIRGLEVKRPTFEANLVAAPRKACATLTKADVPLAFWTGASWAAALATSRDFRMLPQIPQFEALLERVLELDERYDAGSVHNMFITYEMVRLKPPSADRAARAKQHFDRVVELTHGKQAGPYVTYAESVLTVQKNRAEFERMLQLALKLEPAEDPENRLQNVIMQRRARWLLGRVDKLFPR